MNGWKASKETIHEKKASISNLIYFTIYLTTQLALLAKTLRWSLGIGQ